MQTIEQKSEKQAEKQAEGLSPVKASKAGIERGTARAELEAGERAERFALRNTTAVLVELATGCDSAKSFRGVLKARYAWAEKSKAQ